MVTRTGHPHPILIIRIDTDIHTPVHLRISALKVFILSKPPINPSNIDSTPWLFNVTLRIASHAFKRILPHRHFPFFLYPRYGEVCIQEGDIDTTITRHQLSLRVSCIPFIGTRIYISHPFSTGLIIFKCLSTYFWIVRRNVLLGFLGLYSFLLRTICDMGCAHQHFSHFPPGQRRRQLRPFLFNIFLVFYVPALSVFLSSHLHF